MVDEDTNAFNGIMAAFGLPKTSDEEKATRKLAIQDATKNAIEIPLKVMKLSYKVLSICNSMVETGNPNSVTDAGVGALAARSAVIGAFLNVKINAADLEDKDFVQKVILEGEELQNNAIIEEQEILKLVNDKIG